MQNFKHKMDMLASYNRRLKQDLLHSKTELAIIQKQANSAAVFRSKIEVQNIRNKNMVSVKTQRRENFENIFAQQD